MKQVAWDRVLVLLLNVALWAVIIHFLGAYNG